MQEANRVLTEYYARKGNDRNDILTNPGVLFQTLALQKSVVEALWMLPINRNWKVLDVGCGNGASLAQFLAFEFTPSCLYGIDVIPERVQEGKERYPNLNLICGDASQMDYESNSFNIVMESMIFLQMMDNALIQKIANEMLRVVEPSGYIILTDWRYGYGNKYNGLSKKRINQLFKVGTKTTVRCSTHGALLPPIGRFLSKYLSFSYFAIQRILPFCVAQVTTVLQKTG